MATLIPGSASLASRLTPGRRRFAQRLEAKLDDDYLCWLDVPIGKGKRRPDLIVLHPRHGLLVLETRDWKLDAIESLTRDEVTLRTAKGLAHKPNPLQLARQYAHDMAGALERDPRLVFSSGSLCSKLLFPWTYGVVLPNMTRRQVESAGLDEVLEPRRVICQNEMLASVEPDAFQQRLLDMFDVGGFGHLSPEQIDRLRWHLFPEIRVPFRLGNLPGPAEDHPASLPEELPVMDLQQEQLARSLGEGHRVIHGVAGSGKTLILGYRAECLARTSTKPVLVLCFNQALAKRLRHWMEERGVPRNKFVVQNFHGWCRQQLTACKLSLPEGNPKRKGYGDAMAKRVIRAVARKRIPTAQYDAVLIDEGHDFRPEWFQLMVQMVDPDSNSLLVLYDDAQALGDAGTRRDFSFKSVGVQAQGRTTILRVNYRNTQEILEFASRFAGTLLKPEEAAEDGVPRLRPVSAGRHGARPQRVRMPTIGEAAQYLSVQFLYAHERGMPWKDMAVLFRRWLPVGRQMHEELEKAGVPVTLQKDVEFVDEQDTVKLITFQASKGLEFRLVGIAWAELHDGPVPINEEDARLLYVAMTRATQELIVLESPPASGNVF